MKILIIDDEPLARQRLHSVIDELGRGTVVAEAGNGQQALSLCQQHQPDVVLLDIRMPGMSGIEVAHHINKLSTPPAIIFTTAYDDYAIPAFETHAVDYLLKPIRRDRLESALGAAKRLTRVQMQELGRGVDEADQRQHISARLGGELRLIPIDDIRYLQAEHKYVTVRYGQGTVLIEESLKSLEEEFPGEFLRVHRNALVALRYIASLEKERGGGHRLKLRDVQETLEVSRRHLPNVRKVMKAL
ncbi:MAG: LytTR family DNA-binding domain-containing protein [Gammaproteobacteria bacterium]|jgi:two-component system, LytTR family, response regulator AlgR